METPRRVLETAPSRARSIGIITNAGMLRTTLAGNIIHVLRLICTSNGAYIFGQIGIPYFGIRTQHKNVWNANAVPYAPNGEPV